tara:strand:- start:317 stop:475 length:159 start_codon:yes stop_codon:yes gene_type:complete
VYQAALVEAALVTLQTALVAVELLVKVLQAEQAVKMVLSICETAAAEEGPDQ